MGVGGVTGEKGFEWVLKFTPALPPRKPLRLELYYDLLPLWPVAVRRTRLEGRNVFAVLSAGTGTVSQRVGPASSCRGSKKCALFFLFGAFNCTFFVLQKKMHLVPSMTACARPAVSVLFVHA